MKKKIFAVMLILALTVAVAATFIACGSPNVTLADLEGTWNLERYQIAGATTATFFSRITFNAEGGFTAVPTVGDTPITGTVSLDGRRITFNSGNAAIDGFFSASEYRVRMDGNNMIWDWYLLNSRQNASFTWNAA